MHNKALCEVNTRKGLNSKGFSVYTFEPFMLYLDQEFGGEKGKVNKKFRGSNSQWLLDLVISPF